MNCINQQNKIVLYFNDNSFDDRLSHIDHYKQYPQMLPLIGSNYKTSINKVIVIGESHYLPYASIIHHNAENWYQKSSVKELSPMEMKWTNTRGTAGYAKNQKYKSKGHSIYRNIEHAIKIGLNCEPGMDNYFRHIAYYNYFQRPALQGDSLKLQQIDEEIAYETLCRLYEILNFDTAIFVSKLAYWSFIDHSKQHGLEMEFAVERTVHPSCSWWNRAHTNWHNGVKVKCTGKDQFIRIINRKYG